MKNIEHALQTIGLTKNESKIYLAVLTMGKSNITDIAKYAQIQRTAVHTYIIPLLQQDLIKKTILGKRIYYIPQNPKKLLEIAETRKKKIKKILPNFTEIYNTSSIKPVVHYYEGKIGIRAVYREMTQTSHIVWSVFSADRYYRVFKKEDAEEFLENIYTNGGKLRDLVENSSQGKRYVKENRSANIGKSKLLPKDFTFSVETIISGNKVAIISLIDLVAVVIKNKEIANSQLNFIKFVWKNL